MKYKGLWLVSVIIAFWLGIMTSNTQLNETAEFTEYKPNIDNAQKRLITSENAQFDEAGIKEIIQLTPLTDSFNLVNVVQKISELNSDSSMFVTDIEKMSEVYQLLKMVPLEKTFELLDSLSISESDSTSMLAMGYLLGKYAEQDPQGALAYLSQGQLSEIAKVAGKTAIYGSWAKYDPDNAFDSYLEDSESLDNNMFVNTSIIPLLGAVAESNLDAAIEKLAVIKNKGLSTSMAVAGISASFTESYQYEQLINKMSSLKDNRLVKEAAYMWAAKKPAQAAQWLATYQDDEQKAELEHSVLSVWARTEFEQAANWYLANNASVEDRQQAVSNILKNTGFGVNPQKVLDWINNQPDIDNVQAVSTLLTNTSYSNPQFAELHIELLSDEKTKNRLAHSIYMSYKRQNTQKANDYLENSPYKLAISQKINRMEELRKKKVKG